MSNKPTDRDSETPICTFVDPMSSRICGRTKAQHTDLKSHGLTPNPPHGFTSVQPSRRASSAEEERASAEVVATVAGYLRMWCGDSEKAESHAIDIIKMIEAVERPSDDERAVLAELLRLYDYAERTKQDDTADGDDEAFFAEWHATYARAREVLARREKEGKDK